jgi:hypothetical protein
MIDSTDRAARILVAYQAWGRHRSEVSDEPTASLDDLEWVDDAPRA